MTSIPPLPEVLPAVADRPLTTGAVALQAAAAPAAVPQDWQQLPTRGARIAAVGGAIGMLAAMIGITLAVSALFSHWQGWLWKAPLALAIGLPFGAWLSWKRHRRTSWRLDDHALAVKHQHLCYQETRVPRARVQHLDVHRGPLQRMAGLATLVVHTAGSRLDAVSLSGLELADAEALRELLARPDDHDGL